MQQYKEGSLVVLMLGLFWLAGIVTMVLYAMVAHLSTVANLREVELRYWYLIQGGMRTALAHINDASELYLQEQGEALLYEGPWQVDPRHTDLTLRLAYQGLGEGKGTIAGELHEKESSLIRLRWHIAYVKKDQKWHFVSGERIYER